MLRAMNKNTIWGMGLALLLPVTAWAQQYSPNWRQDTLEMIEDGRNAAANAMLEEAVGRTNFITDPIERINHCRYLGEAYERLGRTDIAREQYDKAMDSALQLKPVWRSLSAVISVLELQAESDDIDTSRELIQQSLDAKLLPRMAEDRYATEIGRYVKRFGKASRAQVYQLLEQLHSIEQAPVRKKAFFALTELDFAPFTGEGKYSEVNLPMGMDQLERFLWFAVMAKYYAESGLRLQFSQQVEGMQKAYDLIGEAQQQKYRSIYRGVKKMSYAKPEPATPEADDRITQEDLPDLTSPRNPELKHDPDLSLDPEYQENPEMLDLYYGGSR